MIATTPFGRTGHDSTRVIFGAAAFGRVTQDEADQTMELIRRHGINHLDTAASYGESELRLGPGDLRRRRPQDDGDVALDAGAGGVAEGERAARRPAADDRRLPPCLGGDDQVVLVDPHLAEQLGGHAPDGIGALRRRSG